MNFLRKELITSDIVRFAKALEEKIDDSQITLYESDLPEEKVALGFQVTVIGSVFHVYMPYIVNEYNEYAVLDKQWTIEEVGGKVTSGYPTLQEVIDFISEKRWESFIPKTWRDIEGKWNDEPDVLEVEDKGYHMVVLRNPEMGNLNGYVGININNPLFSLDYDNSKLSDTWVHGGLSFAGMGNEIPFAPFKKTYWYFGFDTLHAFDLVPNTISLRQSIPALSRFYNSEESSKETYRDLNYVSEQVNQLVVQLQGIAEKQDNHKVNHKRIYRKLHKSKRYY